MTRIACTIAIVLSIALIYFLPGLKPDEVIDLLCQAAGIKPHSALPDDTTIICIDRRVGAKVLPCADRMFSPSLVPASVSVGN